MISFPQRQKLTHSYPQDQTFALAELTHPSTGRQGMLVDPMA